MSSRLSALAWAGIDLVLPPRCPACGTVVAHDREFCADCWRELEFVLPPLCARCGVPFEHDRGEDALCGGCLADPPRYTSARSALVYGGKARALALALKHSDKPHLADVMALHMARAGAAFLDPARSILVPVPLHRWRLWKRGYNQAAVMARAIARRTRVPVALDALIRVRATRMSGGLSAEERVANVRRAIAPGPSAGRIEGREVVLVDDVLTTGATANACAEALLKRGASAVHLLTWTRVVHGDSGSHM